MELSVCEVLYEDISLLADIYDLNKSNFNMVKEVMRAEHAYRMIGDPQILEESFTDMLNKMGDFFKNMAEKIKEFFRKIFMFINAQFMEIDKFVKTYKKELDQVKGVNFTIMGYKFTLGDKPDITPFKELVDSYNSSISDVKSLKKDEINSEETKMLSTENLDKIRGIVLGVNKNITEEDYSEVARKTYRNGETDTTEIEVDDSMFRATINSIDSLVKLKKDAEKYRDQLIFALHKAEQFFDKKASALYVDNKKKINTSKLKMDEDNKLSKDDEVYNDYSDSSISVMNRFIRYKYNYTRTLASIINIATNEYCNAYKDNVKMARQIILGGMKKENRASKNTDTAKD